MKPRWPLLLLLGALGPWAACGGGSSSSGTGSSPTPSTVNNTLAVVSNLGVDNDYADGLFASVTVCVPGTSNCQTIDNVLVDTGSFGLRLLASQLTLPLPASSDSNGDPLGECVQYSDAYTWGSVATADVQLAGETASAVPIQIIGPSSFPAAPADCTDSGLPSNDTQATLGANGVLGIGVFQYDCGGGCAPPSSTIPPVYFGCPSSGCSATLVPLATQVQNPVPLFAQDNNGVVVNLPAVPALGSPSVNGTLEFGINTQSDNTMTGTTILTADDYGDFATEYDSVAYSGSLLDTGSNGIFFLDQNTLNIPLCGDDESGFYCPTSTTSYSATNLSVTTSASTAATWDIANAITLFNTGNAAFDNLGGPNSGEFDFGLPFFFGRAIYFCFEGGSANNTSGPFYAY